MHRLDDEKLADSPIKPIWPPPNTIAMPAAAKLCPSSAAAAR